MGRNMEEASLLGSSSVHNTCGTKTLQYLMSDQGISACTVCFMRHKHEKHKSPLLESRVVQNNGWSLLFLVLNVSFTFNHSSIVSNSANVNCLCSMGYRKEGRESNWFIFFVYKKMTNSSIFRTNWTMSGGILMLCSWL